MRSGEGSESVRGVRGGGWKGEAVRMGVKTGLEGSLVVVVVVVLRRMLLLLLVGGSVRRR